MNFLTMKQELADRLGAFDQTVSGDDTMLGRWVNLAYTEITGSGDWPFLKKLDIIQTVPDYSTGTVSINAGGTALTFSAGPTVSMANRFIQFTNTDDWYEITAHTAASTSATIDPAYLGTTNLTGGSYTIRKLYYGMDSTFDSVYDVKVASPGVKQLQTLSPFYMDIGLQFLQTTGTPESYWMGLSTSAGLPQVSFYPTPDDTYNVYIVGKKSITDLSNTTDSPIFPAPYHHLILDLASYYGFSKLDDTRATTFFQKYEDGLAKMKAIYSQQKGRHRVMRAIDAEEDMSEERVKMTVDQTAVWNESNWG